MFVSYPNQSLKDVSGSNGTAMTISSANSFYLIRFPVNSVFELKKYCQTMVGNVRKSNVMATPRFSVASSWPPHKTFLGRPNRQPDRATGMAGCTSS